MQTAYACKMSDFNMLYEKLKNQYPNMASYLEKVVRRTNVLELSAEVTDMIL